MSTHLHALSLLSAAHELRKNVRKAILGGTTESTTTISTPEQPSVELNCYFCDAELDPQTCALVDEERGHVAACCGCANDIEKNRSGR